MGSDGALDCISAVREVLGDAVRMGAVVTAQNAEEAIEADAEFVGA